MSRERIILNKGISNPVNPDSDKYQRGYKPILPTRMHRESEFSPTVNQDYLVFGSTFGFCL